MKILILGGYGTFGVRLTQLFAEEARLTLIIAGRSMAKASAFCDKLPLGATKIPLAFDRDGDLEVQILTAQPDLLIDATGPFQRYGEEPYRVVKACIKLQVHYMDLADDATFVINIAQFNEQAKTKNVYVLSGVSSFPALSAAAVRHLAHGLAQVTEITGGVAPSPFAGVGLNVIRAIASYSGKPLPLTRNGQRGVGFALTESLRYTIAPPGYLPLRNRRFSLVDVPDLQLLPLTWPELKTIWIGAGTAPEILHRTLNALAWLVRLRLIPSLSPFAKLFHYVSNNFRWGEHRGGMFMSIRGVQADGEPVERAWHLIAEGDDGPTIPAMAVAAVVRRSLAGKAPTVGARPCVAELELEDFVYFFNQRKIVTSVSEKKITTITPSLYQQLLGNAWSRLPEPIRNMHDHTTDWQAQGMARVERGTSWLATLVATIVGFPHATDNVPIKVSFQLRDGGELWSRTFGKKSFSSFQTRGEGRLAGLLCERFGPMTFDLALVIDDEKLHLVVRGWRFLGLRLPTFLAPSGNTYESAENDRFNFHVEIAHPLTGLIVRYTGWLIPT